MPKMSQKPKTPRRMAALVGLTSIASIGVLCIATVRFAQSPPDAIELVTLGILLTLAVVAEHFPMPVDSADVQGYSLSAVFIIGGTVLFGWVPMTLICALHVLVTDLFEHRPPLRVAYNGEVLVLATLAGGLLTSLLPTEESALELVGAVTLAAIAYGLVDFFLVSLALSFLSNERLLRTARQILSWGAAPFLLEASSALALIVLWQRAPLLVLSLGGPLIAIALYGRQKVKTHSAMRLAFTDPLTGLGNTRHFHDRLQRSLDGAEESGASLALCMFDLDNLKEVNDEFGHPAGDRVLIAVAGRLRHGGEAFRLGGDEFAVLLPSHSGEEAVDIATAILERTAALKIADLPKLTMSCGVVIYPSERVDRHDLLRLADSALYWAKTHGKNRVRLYHTEALSSYQLERLGSTPDVNARMRAAASLADAVDARDAHAGAHSRRVGDLSAQLGIRLGLSEEETEILRLAGHLHDVGKLAIPEELLCKRSPLTDSERVVLQRHPQIGFRMLEGLALGPIAAWVLRHHERWDGTGYPSGLTGDEIPLGARIIFVADAWDSMTSERTYRSALEPEQALAELEERAGSQFDSEVVQALATELGLLENSDQSNDLTSLA
jgi:diguanylate cyclase (GGDEF)-like protein